MAQTSQKYALCRFCIEREGPGESFEEVKGPQCAICGGLFDKIPTVANVATRKIRRYDFRNFSVGMTLPEGVQEREDELRSAFRLKGSETVKTQAARVFAQLVSAMSGKPIEKLRPDLTVLANLSGESVSVSSKPLHFYGRYSKPPGLSQRRELCPHCSGRGCAKCGRTGYRRTASVESLLRKRLASFSGSDRMVFTWIGSEDSGSRVYPPGRPFVAELKNPVRRVIPGSFVATNRGRQVRVRQGKALPGKPTGIPPFKFRTVIRCISRSKVTIAQLSEVRKHFRRKMVDFDRPHNRPTAKMVYRAEARGRGRSLTVEAVMDGGLPIKRFVSGDLVSPSVSEVLKTEVRCRSFDICEVVERGNFSYGEITRV